MTSSKPIKRVFDMTEPHNQAPAPRGQVVISYDDKDHGLWMDKDEYLMLVAEQPKKGFSNTWRFLGRGGIELEFDMDAVAAERIIEHLIAFLESPRINWADTYVRTASPKYQQGE